MHYLIVLSTLQVIDLVLLSFVVKAVVKKRFYCQSNR